MIWDYVEVNPFVGAAGDPTVSLNGIIKAFECSPYSTLAKVRQSDARSNNFYKNKPIYCTDPPYYDNIGYADLSDYFYTWLRRSLGSIYPDLFRTLLTPK